MVSFLGVFTGFTGFTGVGGFVFFMLLAILTKTRIVPVRLQKALAPPRSHLGGLGEAVHEIILRPPTTFSAAYQREAVLRFSEEFGTRHQERLVLGDCPDR